MAKKVALDSILEALASQLQFKRTPQQAIDDVSRAIKVPKTVVRGALEDPKNFMKSKTWQNYYVERAKIKAENARNAKRPAEERAQKVMGKATIISPYAEKELPKKPITPTEQSRIDRAKARADEREALKNKKTIKQIKDQLTPSARKAIKKEREKRIKGKNPVKGSTKSVIAERAQRAESIIAKRARAVAARKEIDEAEAKRRKKLGPAGRRAEDAIKAKAAEQNKRYQEIERRRAIQQVREKITPEVRKEAERIRSSGQGGRGVVRKAIDNVSTRANDAASRRWARVERTERIKSYVSAIRDPYARRLFEGFMRSNPGASPTRAITWAMGEASSAKSPRGVRGGQEILRSVDAAKQRKTSPAQQGVNRAMEARTAEARGIAKIEYDEIKPKILERISDPARRAKMDAAFDRAQAKNEERAMRQATSGHENRKAEYADNLVRHRSGFRAFMDKMADPTIPAKEKISAAKQYGIPATKLEDIRPIIAEAQKVTGYKTYGRGELQKDSRYKEAIAAGMSPKDAATLSKIQDGMDRGKEGPQHARAREIIAGGMSPIDAARQAKTESYANDKGGEEKIRKGIGPKLGEIFDAGKSVYTPPGPAPTIKSVKEKMALKPKGKIKPISGAAAVAGARRGAGIIAGQTYKLGVATGRDPREVRATRAAARQQMMERMREALVETAKTTIEPPIFSGKGAAAKTDAWRKAEEDRIRKSIPITRSGIEAAYNKYAGDQKPLKEGTKARSGTTFQERIGQRLGGATGIFPNMYGTPVETKSGRLIDSSGAGRRFGGMPTFSSIFDAARSDVDRASVGAARPIGDVRGVDPAILGATSSASGISAAEPIVQGQTPGQKRAEQARDALAGGTKQLPATAGGPTIGDAAFSKDPVGTAARLIPGFDPKNAEHARMAQQAAKNGTPIDQLAINIKEDPNARIRNFVKGMTPEDAKKYGIQAQHGTRAAGIEAYSKILRGDPNDSATKQMLKDIEKPSAGIRRVQATESSAAGTPSTSGSKARKPSAASGPVASSGPTKSMHAFVENANAMGGMIKNTYGVSTVDEALKQISDPSTKIGQAFAESQANAPKEAQGFGGQRKASERYTAHEAEKAKRKAEKIPTLPSAKDGKFGPRDIAQTLGMSNPLRQGGFGSGILYGGRINPSEITQKILEASDPMYGKATPNSKITPREIARQQQVSEAIAGNRGKLTDYVASSLDSKKGPDRYAKDLLGTLAKHPEGKVMASNIFGDKADEIMGKFAARQAKSADKPAAAKKAPKGTTRREVPQIPAGTLGPPGRPTGFGAVIKSGGATPPPGGGDEKKPKDAGAGTPEQVQAARDKVAAGLIAKGVPPERAAELAKGMVPDGATAEQRSRAYKNIGRVAGLDQKNPAAAAGAVKGMHGGAAAPEAGTKKKGGYDYKQHIKGGDAEPEKPAAKSKTKSKTKEEAKAKAAPATPAAPVAKAKAAPKAPKAAPAAPAAPAPNAKATRKTKAEPAPTAKPAPKAKAAPKPKAATEPSKPAEKAVAGKRSAAETKTAPSPSAPTPPAVMESAPVARVPKSPAAPREKTATPQAPKRKAVGEKVSTKEAAAPKTSFSQQYYNDLGITSKEAQKTYREHIKGGGSSNGALKSARNVQSAIDSGVPKSKVGSYLEARQNGVSHAAAVKSLAQSAQPVRVQTPKEAAASAKSAAAPSRGAARSSSGGSNNGNRGSGKTSFGGPRGGGGGGAGRAAAGPLVGETPGGFKYPGANTGILGSAQGAIGQLTKSVVTAQVIGKFGQLFSQITGGLIGFNMKLEEANVAFKTLFINEQRAMGTFIGDTSIAEQKAQLLTKQIQNFANVTPFRFPELVTAAERMKAFGFSTQEIMPSLQGIGDAVAALGGEDDKLRRITYALGQMKQAGRVYQNDMMQLSNAGIAGYELLAKGLLKEFISTGQVVLKSGKDIYKYNQNDVDIVVQDIIKNGAKSSYQIASAANSQIATAYKALSIDPVEAIRRYTKRGTIDGKAAARVIIQGLETTYRGGMDQLSRTMQGAISTVQDTSQYLIATAFKPMYEKIKDFFYGLGQFMMGAGGKRVAEGLADTVGAFAESAGKILPKVGAEIKRFFVSFTSAGKNVTSALSSILVNGQNFISFLTDTFGAGIKYIVDIMGTRFGQAAIAAVAAMKLIGTAIAANPIVVAMGAIIGAVGMMVRGIDEVNKMGGMTSDNFEKLTEEQKNTAIAARQVRQSFSDIANTFSRIKNSVGPGISKAFSAIAKAIANIGSKSIVSFVKVLETFLTVLSKVLEKISPYAGELAQVAIAFMAMKVANSGINTLTSTISALAAAMTSVAGAAVLLRSGGIKRLLGEGILGGGLFRKGAQIVGEGGAITPLGSASKIAQETGAPMRQITRGESFGTIKEMIRTIFKGPRPVAPAAPVGGGPMLGPSIEELRASKGAIGGVDAGLTAAKSVSKIASAGKIILSVGKAGIGLIKTVGKLSVEFVIFAVIIENIGGIFGVIVAAVGALIRIFSNIGKNLGVVGDVLGFLFNTIMQISDTISKGFGKILNVIIAGINAIAPEDRTIKIIEDFNAEVSKIIDAGYTIEQANTIAGVIRDIRLEAAAAKTPMDDLTQAMRELDSFGAHSMDWIRDWLITWNPAGTPIGDAIRDAKDRIVELDAAIVGTDRTDFINIYQSNSDYADVASRAIAQVSDVVAEYKQQLIDAGMSEEKASQIAKQIEISITGQIVATVKSTDAIAAIENILPGIAIKYGKITDAAKILGSTFENISDGSTVVTIVDENGVMQQVKIMGMAAQNYRDSAASIQSIVDAYANGLAETGSMSAEEVAAAAAQRKAEIMKILSQAVNGIYNGETVGYAQALANAMADFSAMAGSVDTGALWQAEEALTAAQEAADKIKASIDPVVDQILKRLQGAAEKQFAERLKSITKVIDEQKQAEIDAIKVQTDGMETTYGILQKEIAAQEKKNRVLQIEQQLLDARKNVANAAIASFGEGVDPLEAAIQRREAEEAMTKAVQDAELERKKLALDEQKTTIEGIEAQYQLRLDVLTQALEDEKLAFQEAMDAIVEKIKNGTLAGQKAVNALKGAFTNFGISLPSIVQNIGATGTQPIGEMFTILINKSNAYKAKIQEIAVLEGRIAGINGSAAATPTPEQVAKQQALAQANIDFNNKAYIQAMKAAALQEYQDAYNAMLFENTYGQDGDGSKPVPPSMQKMRGKIGAKYAELVGKFPATGDISAGAIEKMQTAFNMWHSYLADPSVMLFGKKSRVGGKLATGGSARAGQTYLVGEKGPEILTMGTGAGQIISNAHVSRLTDMFKTINVRTPNVGKNIGYTSGGKYEMSVVINNPQVRSDSDIDAIVEAVNKSQMRMARKLGYR